MAAGSRCETDGILAHARSLLLAADERSSGTHSTRQPVRPPAELEARTAAERACARCRDAAGLKLIALDDPTVERGRVSRSTAGSPRRPGSTRRRCSGAALCIGILVPGAPRARESGYASRHAGAAFPNFCGVLDRCRRRGASGRAPGFTPRRSRVVRRALMRRGRRRSLPPRRTDPSGALTLAAAEDVHAAGQKQSNRPCQHRPDRP